MWYFQKILALGIGFIIGLLISERFTNRYIEETTDLEAIVRARWYTTTEAYRYNKAGSLADPFDPSVTLERLQSTFSYIPGVPEKNLFQIGDLDYEDKDFKDKNLINEWRSLNPEYEYFYRNATDISEMIEEAFLEHLPEVVMAYNLMDQGITKAEFGRYLLVYLNGGVYTDINSKACRSIKDWDNTDSSMVVGVSVDNNILDWIHTSTRLAFSHNTINIKKHHPFLARLISNIVEASFKVGFEAELSAKDNKRVIEECRAIKAPNWTGREMFSKTLYEYLNSLQDATVYHFSLERSTTDIYGPETDALISWKTFTAIKQPVKIHDSLILPLESFEAPVTERLCDRKETFVISEFGSNKKGSVSKEQQDGPSRKGNLRKIIGGRRKKYPSKKNAKTPKKQNN